MATPWIWGTSCPRRAADRVHVHLGQHRRPSLGGRGQLRLPPRPVLADGDRAPSTGRGHPPGSTGEHRHFLKGHRHSGPPVVDVHGHVFVHNDDATLAWFVPEFSRAMRPGHPAAAESFARHLLSPGRVVIELVPQRRLGFDGAKMWAAAPSAAPGRLTPPDRLDFPKISGRQLWTRPPQRSYVTD